jgi:hypothetical protein
MKVLVTKVRRGDEWCCSLGTDKNVPHPGYEEIEYETVSSESSFDNPEKNA